MIVQHYLISYVTLSSSSSDSEYLIDSHHRAYKHHPPKGFRFGVSHPSLRSYLFINDFFGYGTEKLCILYASNVDSINSAFIPRDFLEWYIFSIDPSSTLYSRSIIYIKRDSCASLHSRRYAFHYICAFSLPYLYHSKSMSPSSLA